MRLIATDLDGTLLSSGHRIGERTKAAFRAARTAGIKVVAVSGRQPYSIAAVVAGTALEGLVIGSNGAVGMDTVTRRVLFEEQLDATTQRDLVYSMIERFPGIRARTVRSAGDVHIFGPGWRQAGGAEEQEMAWPVEVHEVGLEEVFAEPCLKLVLQHDEIKPAELLTAAQELALPGCHPTTSGAPFLEVGPVGVNKAVGLERLCAMQGISRDAVVAFGDNINDVEMLSWAGLGVAMSNATPEAKAVAGQITGSNDEDGIAQVIEELLK